MTPATLTDLYQLTMAGGYHALGNGDRRACFHLYFRRPPFGGGYAVAAGLAAVTGFLKTFHFDALELQHLKSLTGNDGRPLFSQPFIDYLRDLQLDVDVDAVPEGTVVFGNQPLLRVTGPLLHCQLLETTLLNLINFPTLIATKAARIVRAAGGDPVLEFGLRRAQGPDGGLTASRAAYVGGVDATSNVLAGREFGIPVKGTHAHSWVMSFPTEREAFESYARAMPNNCVLLVDTYDTLQGVREAIRTGLALRERGHELAGVRLDSGDLAYLSIDARKMLDEAGFPDARIVASNDLDERTIEDLKHQGARVDTWGVGTNLATGGDQPALGGVYKLAAIQNDDGTWESRVKLSEQRAKTSIPGILQVRRYSAQNLCACDMIYDTRRGEPDASVVIAPDAATKRKAIPHGTVGRDLLQPVLRAGKVVRLPDDLGTIRARCRDELSTFHPAVLRLLNPHVYPVGLEPSLFDERRRMIEDHALTQSLKEPNP